MQVYESTNDRDIEQATSAGFMPSGKVRGKYPFHVGQGKSGKVSETCNGMGKKHISNVGQGKNVIFIITEECDLFSLHLKFTLF